MTAQEFINKYGGDIIRASLGSKIFASVFMAQGMLESGMGNSILAKQYNNLFGIKSGTDWKGKTIELTSDEFINGSMIPKKSMFRVYNSPLDSINDRAEFIKEKFPEVLSANTAHEQAIALGNSKYATDPGYKNKILKLIYDHNLITLDKRKEKMKNIEIAIALLVIITAGLRIYKLLKTA